MKMNRSRLYQAVTVALLLCVVAAATITVGSFRFAPDPSGDAEFIARAQQKGLCTLRFTPQAAAGFLLSALNGILIEHLFMANNPLDSEEAVAMVSEWLFGQENPSGGGKAVA